MSESIPNKIWNNDHTLDGLSLGRHIGSLTRFLRDCDTPTTVGLQGGAGSGKTFILNLIHDKFKSSQGNQNLAEEIVVFASVWPHSFNPTHKHCLLSLAMCISEKISRELSMEADFAGLHDKIRDCIHDSTDLVNYVELIQSQLAVRISAILSAEKAKKKRLIFLIDDLDKIESSLAVKMMEFLNNILGLKGCVILTTLDYQHVVSGLSGRLGKVDAQNEWQFRAVFDRLVSIPYHIPHHAYDVDKYLLGLLTEISFFDPDEIEQFSQILRLVNLSLGSNPRLIKRLTNSLSLISYNLPEDQYKDQADEVMSKSILLSLVCIQISFPRIYDLLMVNPVFSEWDDDFASNSIRGEIIPHDLEHALASVRRTHEIDFDETWEQALFKIMWAKNWQRNKVIEVSRVLSIIKDDIIGAAKIAELGNIIKEGLRATAATSIATDEDFLEIHLINSFQQDNLLAQAAYWNQLMKKLEGQNTLFNDIPEGNSSIYLARKDHNLPSNTQFLLSLRARPFCRFESICGDITENLPIFEGLLAKKDLIEEIVGCKVVFNLDRDSAIQYVDVIPNQSEYPKRGLISEIADKKLVADWIQTQATVMPRFEKAIRMALEGKITKEQLNEFRERNSAVMSEDFALEVRTMTGA